MLRNARVLSTATISSTPGRTNKASSRKESRVAPVPSENRRSRAGAANHRTMPATNPAAATGSPATRSSAGMSLARSSTRKRGTKRTMPAATPNATTVWTTRNRAVTVKNSPAVVGVSPRVTTIVSRNPSTAAAAVPPSASTPARNARHRGGCTGVERGTLPTRRDRRHLSPTAPGRWSAVTGRRAPTPPRAGAAMREAPTVGGGRLLPPASRTMASRRSMIMLAADAQPPARARPASRGQSSPR